MPTENHAPPAPPSSLTGLRPSDVEALLADSAPARRSEVATKVAAEIDAGNLSEAERQLAVDILRTMASDAEIVVRQAVALSLRRSARLPHDVAIKLAHDDSGWPSRSLNPRPS